MTEERKGKEDKIPRLKEKAGGELVDTATGQCLCCKDKLSNG